MSTQSKWDTLKFHNACKLFWNQSYLKSIIIYFTHCVGKAAIVLKGAWSKWPRAQSQDLRYNGRKMFWYSILLLSHKIGRKSYHFQRQSSWAYLEYRLFLKLLNSSLLEKKTIGRWTFWKTHSEPLIWRKK